MTGTDLYCVVDAGTSGVKVGLVDSWGNLTKSSYRPYGVSSPRPGFVEQSVSELLQAELEALGELLDGISGHIASVSCSSQRATVIGVCSGAPMASYVGWQDRRGLDLCHKMHEEVGDSEFYRQTGLVIDTVASWSKIEWLNRHFPQIDEYYTHQGMLLRQFGIVDNLCAPSEASYTGLYDIHKGGWHAGLISHLGITDEQLPTVVSSGTIVGEVTDPSMLQAGLPAGTPVVMGGGDLQLGVLGCGVVRPGMVATGIGTGGHCVTPTESPVFDPKRRLNCLAHVEDGTWEVEGLARASGGAMRWLRDNFSDHRLWEIPKSETDLYDLMTSEADRWPPGADGLVFVPALAGLGAPVNSPQFGGTLVGLRLGHDSAAVTRATMEGICFEQRSILEALISILDQEPTEVRAWGGAAKSEIWCQMQADVYAIPVARTREQDASLIGAAICGGVATGALEDFISGAERMVHVERRWEPDRNRAHQYSFVYEKYLDVINTFLDSGLVDRLEQKPDGPPSGGTQ